MRLHVGKLEAASGFSCVFEFTRFSCFGGFPLPLLPHFQAPSVLPLSIRPERHLSLPSAPFHQDSVRCPPISKDSFKNLQVLGFCNLIMLELFPPFCWISSFLVAEPNSALRSVSAVWFPQSLCCPLGSKQLCGCWTPCKTIVNSWLQNPIDSHATYQ